MDFTLDRRKFLKLSGTAMLLAPLACSSIGNRTVRFGLVTDSHYADREPAGTRYYRESTEKMRACIEVFNREKVDFVVHLGDFKDEDPNKNEADTLRYLRVLEEEYAKFKGPRYHCVGNHDVDSIRKEQFLANIENTGIEKDKSYYSFDQGGLHFVVVDANYHKDGRDQFYKEGADWQDPNIPAKQVAWLKADLEATELPTIIFGHHPLYHYTGHDSNLNVNNYKEVQQIFEASGKVLAAFHGHVHEENYALVNDIHYSTQLGMVDHSGLENNSFSIVTVDEKQIQLDGYKRVSSHTFE